MSLENCVVVVVVGSLTASDGVTAWSVVRFVSPHDTQLQLVASHVRTDLGVFARRSLAFDRFTAVHLVVPTSEGVAVVAVAEVTRQAVHVTRTFGVVRRHAPARRLTSVAQRS